MFETPGGCVPGKEGHTIRFNDGTGWQVLHYESPPTTGWTQITGFPLGPAVLAGTGVDFLDLAGTVTRQTAFNTGHHQVFVVNFDLAYAYDGARLLRYSGGDWTAIGTIPIDYPNAIWANSEVVVIAGPEQAMYMKRGAEDLVAMAGVPAGHYYGLWGFNDTDLWAGNQAGQLLHYDGNTWTVVATSQRASEVNIIWGIDGDVYYGTRSELGRWNGQIAETLIAPRTDEQSVGYTIRGVWGLSKTEVFISLYDQAYRDYKCGEPFIVWFDGMEFHRF